MNQAASYVIRGGVAGQERLRVLARVMQPTTVALLDRLRLTPGWRGVDVGCGGGDVTLELARRLAPTGSMLGIDLDEIKLGLAREEALAQGFTNVEFRNVQIGKDAFEGPFDLVYSRFLLTHLTDAGAAVAQFFSGLRPGGLLIVEDIDFSGYTAYPDSEEHRRYCEWYRTIVRRNGADPDIGLKVPRMLHQQGFTSIGVSVVQPMSLEGDAKLISPITLENIREGVTAAGLATAGEIDALVKGLYADAGDASTLAGMPRVVQVWGWKPGQERSGARQESSLGPSA